MNKFIIKFCMCVITFGLCNTLFGNEACDAIESKLDETLLLEELSPYPRAGKIYESANEAEPLFIVLHYTKSPDIERTVNTYYRKGFSAHYTTERNGTIYLHITDGNIAFHAGASYWADNYWLNGNSIGIENVNQGCRTAFDALRTEREVNGKILSFKKADGKECEEWQEETLESIANLIKCKYSHIKPWNILGHSDVSPGRKIDPGLLFPWKRLHDEYGVGFWPDDKPALVEKWLNELNHDDYMSLLHAFGYSVKKYFACEPSVSKVKEIFGRNVENSCDEMYKALTDEDTISAFQYHYMYDKFEKDPDYRSGNLDDDTKIMILRHARSIIKLMDKDDYQFQIFSNILQQEDFSKSVKEMISGLFFEFALSVMIENSPDDDDMGSDL